LLFGFQGNQWLAMRTGAAVLQKSHYNAAKVQNKYIPTTTEEATMTLSFCASTTGSAVVQAMTTLVTFTIRVVECVDELPRKTTLESNSITNEKEFVTATLH
jgi:hypothetical protein